MAELPFKEREPSNPQAVPGWDWAPRQTGMDKLMEDEPAAPSRPQILRLWLTLEFLGTWAKHVQIPFHQANKVVLMLQVGGLHLGQQNPG